MRGAAWATAATSAAATSSPMTINTEAAAPPGPPATRPTADFDTVNTRSSARSSTPERARAVLAARHRCLSVSSSNALDNFEVLEELLRERQLILLLDYDGTLTPIVNDPAKALLSDEVRETLRALPRHYVTGIVTGRSLAKIRNFVDVPGLFYAGSHGFDILAPTAGGSGTPNTPVRGGSTGASAHGGFRADAVLQLESTCSGLWEPSVGGPAVDNTPTNKALSVASDCDGDVGDGPSMEESAELRYQVAGEFLPRLQAMRRKLEEAVADIRGAEVEDNMYSISVHYRNCARSDLPRVAELVQAVQAEHAGIRLRTGKEVFELQPDVKWNKGSAVMWMLDMLGLSCHPNQQHDESEPSEHNGGAAGGGDPSYAGATYGHAVGSDCDTQPEVFTIFIGDDKTDEDAFRVFSADGDGTAQQPGLGILVSEESRDTHAAYTLKNPQEVAELLSRLVSIGQSRDLHPVRVIAGPAVRGSTRASQPRPSLLPLPPARAGGAAAGGDPAAAAAAAVRQGVPLEAEAQQHT